MISVDLDKIVTAKGLQEHLASILYEVEEEEKIYVITKQGKPQAALVNVDYLKELTGQPTTPTQEYDRYDQVNVTEPTQPEKTDVAADFPVKPVQTTTVEVPSESPETTTAPQIETKSEPESKPEPITPPTQITDLAQLTASPFEVDQVEDPYSVADEPKPAPAEEQLFDHNGLPIKGQPDPTDGLASGPTNQVTPT